MENLGNTTMWDAYKFMTAEPMDGGRMRIPALHKTTPDGTMTEIQDNEEKSQLLHQMFFFEPPEDAGINPRHRYPKPAFNFKHVIDEQIVRVAKKLSPYKAPGLNDISNSVLTHCVDQLAPYLGHIY